MTIQQKKEIVLKALYKYKFDGRYYEIVDILKEFEPIRIEEASSIGRSLDSNGYIKFSGSKQDASAKITAEGVDYVESNLLGRIEYSPKDLFSESEKKIVIEKLVEFNERLEKIELGQRFIYDDLKEDLEVLITLINTLGKRDWSQLLKGKLIDAGLGSVADKVLEAFLEIFERKLLMD
jgi:hypothetical protein